MVYESDFYSPRRYRPSAPITSYSVTTPRYTSSLSEPRRDQQYSYTYNASTETVKSSPGSSVPTRSYSSSSERVRKSAGSGPGSYNYSTERTSRSSGDRPGSYHSSYSSTTSGSLPYGTRYRHFSYKV